MATYKHLRSSTANKRPTTAIADGQLALNTNTASPGLFFKDSAGTGIVKIGPVHVGTTAPNSTPAAGGSSGNYTGEQWLDTSVSPAQLKVWNGSAWVGVVADELPVSKLQDGEAGQIVQTDSAGTGVEWSSTANLPLGTASAPAYRFQGDTNTGIYSPGADQLAISSNGVGRLFIDASGNVGVGTASPSYSLDVQAGDVRFKRSASDDAAIYFGSTTNNYIYGSNTGNVFTFATNGSERLRITSDGKLGLGTSSPGQLLHVSKQTSGGATAALVSNPNGAAGASAGIKLGVSPEDNSVAKFGIIHERLSSYGGGDTYFCTNYAPDATEVSKTDAAITIKGSTKAVGIGTTSPGSTLDVDGSFNLTGNAIFGAASTNNVTVNGRLSVIGGSITSPGIRGATDTDTGFQIGISANEIAAVTGGSERARIDNSGRLLVGTSSARTVGTAGVLTQIESTGGDAGLSIVRNSNGSTSGGITLAKSRGTANGSSTVVQSGDDLGLVQFAGADGTDLLSVAGRIQCQVDGTPGANDMPGRLVFSTTADGASTPTERMRISANGVTAFLSPGTVLTPSTLAAAGTTAALIYGRHSATTVSNGTQSFTVWSNGDVVNTNNSYGAISDVKLKENIVDANSQWNDLKALQVRNYNLKEGQTHTQIGLIAQEVELVSPGLVNESPDRDEEGNDLGTVTKSVNYSVLYMKAVKALQEAMERIEVLEAKVNALEGN